MRHLRVRLAFPPRTRHPMHQFLVDHPALHREELWSWNFEGAAPAVLFRVEGAREPYRKRIADVDSIAGFDLTTGGDGWFYAFVRGTPTAEEWEWLLAFAYASLLVVPPVVYTDEGDAVFEVVGEPDHLRGLLSELPARVDTTVERVGEYDRRRGPAVPLTDRQREVVAAAVDLGYYDVPRAATLADVAAEVGVASSTVSDHLRKAESVVMSELRGPTG
ncbi:helix-turn-helix domain-containing protein [Halobacterium jilantaiense]|uniref:HTH DNA binding domain-containing protein n=1 Tax=Halobacterium jilantaiense TaxID=355548 RepID=A0A1I0QPC4_9EURY|nr:helix-turn-helix domain-containing protein [Halobacterium jilantaiense]SEW29018.1 HTH DNA binding domain-containing protein [Halobacterium jilantaiense]